MGARAEQRNPTVLCHLVTSSARVKQSKPNHLSLCSQSPGILIANPVQVGFVMMVVLPWHVDVKKIQGALGKDNDFPEQNHARLDTSIHEKFTLSRCEDNLD